MNAHHPKLFAMIRERFPDHLPSEGNLEGVLIRMGFSSTGTKPAKKAFLETFQYLQEETGSESHGSPAGRGVGSSEGRTMLPVVIATEQGKALTKKEARPNMKEDVYTLPEGDVVLQWPTRLSQESFEEVQAWTELMMKKLKRQVTTEPVSDEDAD